LEEKEKRIALLEEQLKEAIKIIDQYIDYFEKISRDGTDLKRVKTKIQKLEADFNELLIRTYACSP
jgi:prefoldin subunit 5